jgi:hypothetical protein
MESKLIKTWVGPMATLAASAALLFALLYSVDVLVTGGPADGASGRFSYFFFDQDHITDAVTGLGTMVAAVLGIVITVVSIVVQLSAERYTGVTAMFLRDRTNVRVMAFYVVACACSVWVSLSVRADFVPRVTLLFMLVLTVLALVMMAPYFGYVFRFLEPASIVRRIQREATVVAAEGALAEGAACADAQARSLAAMEELTDITSNSISGKDKIIASRAVDALKDLALRYLETKSRAKPEWFSIGPQIRDNPDFVAMDPESLTDLEARRTWFEWKVMRQYLGIYNEALTQMRDINYLVAIDTRYIGEKAAEVDDEHLIELVYRFMNSYLRATLNAKDVRTAYNVMNQYRLLVESMLRRGRTANAVTAVGHMKYYALVSYDMKLSFVTETVAYDVGALCQLAHELGSEAERPLLDVFLEIDRPGLEHAHEVALKGVRKAQVKLASYYLSVGAEERVGLIVRDMAGEAPERLRAIREELMRVESKDFWEIIDRGRNFEFMPPKQRAAMLEFFGRFEGLEEAPVSIRRGASS